MFRTPTALGLASATLLAAALPAQAQMFDSVRLVSGAPGRDIGLAGAALLVGKRYIGSDENRVMLVPVLDYQWANGWFAGLGNGVGYNASSTPGLHFGPRLTVDLGRKESRSSALRGMGDVNPSAELGGFVSYSPQQAVSLTASLRAGSGEDHKGVRLDLGASYGFVLSPQLRLRLGVHGTVYNQAHMQTDFGVTAAQAARSGYAVYTPKGGFEDLRASVGLSYAFSMRTVLTTSVSTTTLVGDAKTSPLVRNTSTVSGLAALAYAF
jgi:outer membrane scaffolding protein for murein synthesis (MipA/OmpV family)